MCGFLASGVKVPDQQSYRSVRFGTFTARLRENDLKKENLSTSNFKQKGDISICVAGIRLRDYTRRNPAEQLRQRGLI